MLRPGSSAAESPTATDELGYRAVGNVVTTDDFHATFLPQIPGPRRPPIGVEPANVVRAAADENVVTTSIERSLPLGSRQWVQRTAEKLRLQQSLRPRGRPPGWRKQKSRPRETK